MSKRSIGRLLGGLAMVVYFVVDSSGGAWSSSVRW